MKQKKSIKLKKLRKNTNPKLLIIWVSDHLITPKIRSTKNKKYNQAIQKMNILRSHLKNPVMVNSLKNWINRELKKVEESKNNHKENEINKNKEKLKEKDQERVRDKERIRILLTNKNIILRPNHKDKINST